MIPSRQTSSRVAGAARISIIWVISAFVLFFVAVGVAFIFAQDAARYRDLMETAQGEKDLADVRFTDESQALSDLSTVVGWYDTTAAISRTNLDSLQAELGDLKATFPNMGDDIKDVASSFAPVKAAYIARGREIATLTDTINSLKSEKATLEQSLRQAISDKDSEIADHLKTISDEQANAAQKRTELENRIAALNTQRNDLDAQLRQARAQIDEAGRKFDEERTAWRTREAATRSVLSFLSTPEAADGKVLAVSKDLALGWVDIGANQRLARGTRFTVRDGSVGGKGKVKGFATVTKVEPSRAEVQFTGLVDPFLPVVSGDVIFNPLYDPTGERAAVLAGRFSGRFNENELQMLLSNIGIRVQPGLNFETDYLIVGSELYTDEEGNPLEDPLQVSELAVYKNAEAQGVQIIPIKTLADYFVF